MQRIQKKSKCQCTIGIQYKWHENNFMPQRNLRPLKWSTNVKINKRKCKWIHERRKERICRGEMWKKKNVENNLRRRILLPWLVWQDREIFLALEHCDLWSKLPQYFGQRSQQYRDKCHRGNLDKSVQWNSINWFFELRFYFHLIDRWIIFTLRGTWYIIGMTMFEVNCKILLTSACMTLRARFGTRQTPFVCSPLCLMPSTKWGSLSVTSM